MHHPGTAEDGSHQGAIDVAGPMPASPGLLNGQCSKLEGIQAMALLMIRWGIPLMAVTVLMIPGSGLGVATADYDGPQWLPAGYSMPKGYKMVSCCYGLHLQQDCNLVLYPRDELDKPMWASDTAGKANDCNLIMQDDCNAVIYETGTQNALWASQTAGRGNDCDFWMQDDGNVVIYGDDGEAKWSTNTVVHT